MAYKDLLNCKIITAFITPFHEDGSINFEAIPVRSESLLWKTAKLGVFYALTGIALKNSKGLGDGRGGIITVSGTGTSDIVADTDGTGIYGEDVTVNLASDYGVETQDKGVGIYTKGVSEVKGAGKTFEYKYSGSATGNGTAILFEGANPVNEVNINLVNSTGTTGGITGILAKGTGTLTNTGTININSAGGYAFFKATGGTIVNKGTIPMPIDFSVLTKDNKIVNYHIPLNMMREPKKSDFFGNFTTLGYWNWTANHYTFTIPFGKEKLQAMGIDFKMKESVGPWLETPIRTKKQVEEIHVPDVNDTLGYVFDSIDITIEKLAGEVPLIGFAGSPWTILCYCVEGKGSKAFDIAKSFCFQQPEVAHQLLQKITDTTIAYLKRKVEKGVSAVQVFDSWGGMLSPEDYREFSWKYINQIVEALSPVVPVVVFAKGCWFALEEMAESKVSALGVDWTITPELARKFTQNKVTLQGNFDPARLHSSPETIKKMVNEMIHRFGKDQYIANLGHGILPNIPLENAEAFIRAVVDWKK